MTAPQHRVLRQQYQPSQSQPIPQRYGGAQQQQFNNQAFSPRLPGQPSSSPLHQPPFYQTGAHDMYKSSGVAGTPPAQMMPMPHQQYYMNGGQGPRAPNPNMQVRNQMYFQQQPMRYPNIASTAPRHYYTQPQAVSQYPVMQSSHGQMQPQQPTSMYPTAYPQYAGHGPLPPTMPPVTMQNQMLQPQQIPTTGKRERKLIKIVDPSTNEDITDDIMRSKKQQESVSTPPSGRSSVTGTPPTAVSGGDVAAKFAAQVAAAAGTRKGPAGVADPSVTPIMNTPFVHQEPIVGSPNISGPMANYTPQTYVTGPPQRHHTVHPSQFPHEPINHQASRISHPHNQMPPMSITLQSPQQAYQFSSQPQQQNISGPMQDEPQNISENVHTLPGKIPSILKPGHVKIAGRPPATTLQDEPPKVTETIPEPSHPPVEVVKSQSGSEKPDTIISDVAQDETQNGATVSDTPKDQSIKHDITDVAEPAENKEVPSVPEDLKQAPEKEDTAIRLENKPTAPPPDQSDKEKVVLPDEQLQSNPSQDAKGVLEEALPKSESSAQPVVESGDNDKSISVQSGKAVVDAAQPELRGDMPLPENQSTKEPVQADPDPVKPPNVDATLPETPKPSQQQTEKPTGEHVVVNGVSSDATLDAESPQQTKQDDAPSVKVAESGDKTKGRDPSHSNEKAVTDKNTEKSDGDSAKTKSESNIKYLDDDQWSPANQQGRKQYDSNFLLQFQFRPTSMEKPKDLPNIDCVLEQPHKKNSGPMDFKRGGSDFIPDFALPRNTPRGHKPYGRQSSREHRPPMHRGGRHSGPMIIPKKVVSIDKDVELKTSENAWKPLTKQTKYSAEEMEILAIERDVRVILNKVTPSTFKELMQQVLALKIDTEKKLRKTIDLIFEKAIDEPNFSEAYANMCRQMTQIRVTPEVTPDQPNPSSQVEFRKLLLTKCQREFERDKSDREHLQELKKKMEENTDLEQAPQLKEEYTTAEFSERRRTLGNIRFIGELFKLRMLTEPIMHSCIMTLFKAKDDDHLESLCRLLTTIGKDLDTHKAKQRINQYFEQINKIIAEKRTSSRVRFMLQDVFDLRANNWVPRAIQTQGPKTITQIHQDAKNEQEMLQLKLATTPTLPVKHSGRGAPNRMGNRVGHEDGWTKVQTPKPTRFDPSKMKLLKANTDETKVTLGPSRGFGGWKSGSAGSSITKTGSSGGYSPSSSMDRTPDSAPRSNTPTSMMNRFSALQGPGSEHDYQRRPGGRQGSREGSRSGSRGSMGPPSSNSSMRTPRRDERTSLLETTRKLTSADRSHITRPRRSRETSPVIPKPRPATPQQTEQTHKYNTAIDEEKMQQKSRSILEEFLDIVDFKEATECIEELNAPPTLMHCFVYVGHEFTLEKKKEQRVNVGRLMAHLLKRGRLSVEQYIKGLAELFELATDYEIDIPMVWEYFAEQLAPVFDAENDSEISLNVLETLAAPLREEDRSGVFVAKIVQGVIKRTSLESFIPRWQRSNLSWSKILGKNEQAVSSFLENNQLEDLADCKGKSQQNENSAPAVWQNKSNDRYRLEKDITDLLNQELTNDQIFDWVEKTLSPEAAIDPTFIRALTISVCKRSLGKDPKDADLLAVDEEKISERSILLKKYIDTRPERELQVLYALQNLMVELDQPRNILRKFFDIFYNEDVVQEQTFFKWEKPDIPNEEEGFGIAVASVNMFFTWLRTAEPESD